MYRIPATMQRVHRPLSMLCNSIAACLVAGRTSREPAGRFHADGTTSTWRKPEAGRLKLNFDGSSKTASRKASIGGVYRDHDGQFVLGYAERIGKATSSVAELVALKRGLELALNNGWYNIWIEGDAMTVVDMVANRAEIRSEEDLKHSREITALLPLLDDMSVSHIRREGNKVAHNFARLGHKAAQPRVWRDVPPDEVLRFLRRDAEGTGK